MRVASVQNNPLATRLRLKMEKSFLLWIAVYGEDQLPLTQEGVWHVRIRWESTSDD